MIIVTGASGQLGRAIVESLLTRLPAEQIGASVRNPEKVADLSAKGVRVRRGDYDDAASLAHAFEDATQVLMISSNARAFGGDSLAQHRTAIATAKAAGARRILYTSHMAVSATSAFPPMHDHAATEAMLAEAGIAWTALRNGFYANSSRYMMGDFTASGDVRAPEDGPVSWTAHADLADAAAAILTNEGQFDGPTPPLTASEAPDFVALAAMASELLGRTISRTVVSEEAFRAGMVTRNAPEGAIAISLGFYRAARDGEFSRVDAALERLIGRKPTSIRQVLAKSLNL